MAREVEEKEADLHIQRIQGGPLWLRASECLRIEVVRAFYIEPSRHVSMNLSRVNVSLTEAKRNTSCSFLQLIPFACRISPRRLTLRLQLFAKRW